MSTEIWTQDVIFIIKQIMQILTEKQFIECHNKHTQLRINQLYNECFTFVDKICKDRDSSHGLMHMVKVTYNGLNILFNKLCTNNIVTYFDVEDIIIGCMLHDVADHKYETSDDALIIQVKDFIDYLFKNIICPNIYII